MKTAERDAGALFLLGSGLLLVHLTLMIAAPFLTALLAAATAALLLAPAQRSLAARAPSHPAAVAAALTAMTSLALVVPFFLGGWKLVSEAAEAYPAARAWLEGLPVPGVADARNIAVDHLEKISAWTAVFARTLIKNTAFVFLNLAIFMASLFLFLRDGPRMVRRMTALIPLPEERRALLLARVSDALLAVVNGLFVISLLQGTLAWIGLALFRVPFALLLGSLCAALSPIPFVGSTLVWIPVVAYVFFSGDPAKAAALAVWFMVVVGVSDNLVRPVLLGARMKLPIPLLFIAVIGAMKTFGFAGLFIGPLALALAFGFLDIVRDRGMTDERRSGRGHDAAPAARG